VENCGGEDENWSFQTQLDSPESLEFEVLEEHKEKESLAAEVGNGRQAREAVNIADFRVVGFFFFVD